MHKKLIHRLIIGALLGTAATLLVIVTTYLIEFDLFNAFEAKALDWRYTRRLRILWERRQGNPIEDIIIVDIDNRSLEKLGRFSQWPRTYHAQLINIMSKGGALAVGFDILFMEPDKKEDTDQTLITATANSGIVYHSMAFSMADPDAFLYAMDKPPENFNAAKFSLFLPESISKRFKGADRIDGKLVGLYNAAAGIGFANFSPDNDSVIRTMPMFLNFAGRQYLSLSLAVVMGVVGASPSDLKVVPGDAIYIEAPGMAEGRSLRIPIDKNSRMLINYQGTFQTFRYISYYDILMERVPMEIFDGKIVLVGTSAAGLSDIRPVPFQDAFPGVEVHANLIYNILMEQHIAKQNLFFTILNFLLLAVLLAGMAMIFKPWLSGLIGLIIAASYSLLASYWFAQDAYWLELVRPFMAILFAFLFAFVYRYIDEERNKRFIKNMFQHYLTASVVDELLRRPDMLKLGGERRTATAFFSDIKNFTTLSENLAPEVLVAQLNEYLTAMTNIVFKYQGYLDKYEGDAIMAVFGVPVQQTDHATRACLAALEMQEILVDLRRRWKSQNKPAFHARIGINSGPMIAGNIGGEKRFDYTVIGDAVNLASRLEGANKVFGTDIMISEFTKGLIDSEIIMRELDLIRVKGRAKPVPVYEVLAANRGKLSNSQLVAIVEFEKGLAAYRKRRWDDALAAFSRAAIADASDGPARTYVERCEFYKKNPVPLNWDGVFEMKTK